MFECQSKVEVAKAVCQKVQKKNWLFFHGPHEALAASNLIVCVKVGAAARTHLEAMIGSNSPY